MSLRSWDDAGDADGGPGPAAADQVKGGVVITCPECGSHWTVVEGDIVAVYLDAELGDLVLSLAKEGTLRRLGWRGQFESYTLGPKDGYTLTIEPLPYANEELDLPQMDLESAILRVMSEDGFVDVGLRYVDNEAGEFGVPPTFD